MKNPHESNISEYHTITDFEWTEDARLELRIHVKDKLVEINVGPHHYIDVNDSTLNGVISQLEGWRDIFSAGVEYLRKQKG